MNDLESTLTNVLARKADDVDVRPVDGFAESPYTTVVSSADRESGIQSRRLAVIDLERMKATSAPRPGSRRVYGILAAAAAAAVVAVLALVISNDDEPIAVDTSVATVAATPLEEPTAEEVAEASNLGAYLPGSGPTEVTAARRYVSLRTCASRGNADERCDGPKGWAYVTGSADTPVEHFGLLGIGDELVLSALDDRYFVASAPSSSQDPTSAEPTWLIDSVTGQRGLLTWQDEPTAMNSGDQELVLFPVLHPDSPQSGAPFLPRVVDRRDWTVRPLSVPEDATPALAIHQPGSGRIWIGTASNGAEVGLAYTDDGGVSWTNVELPESLRAAGDELSKDVARTWKDGSLVVAATGDHVAVTAQWDPSPGDLFVTSDAGEHWSTFALDPAYGNGRGLFVLSDDRLLLVSSRELGEGAGSSRRGTIVTETLRVSSSAADWSQLKRSTGTISQVVAVSDSAVEVNQQRIVVVYDTRGPTLSPTLFSTDLNDSWTISGLSTGPSFQTCQPVGLEPPPESAALENQAPRQAAVTADYRFENSLDNSVGAATALSVIGVNATGFADEAVFGETRPVFTFDRGSGVELTPASTAIGSEYAIELVVRLDRLRGYVKIVDFNNATVDCGLYSRDGRMDFFPISTGSGAALEADSYAHVVLTRDATDTVVAYVNGSKQLSFHDTADIAVIGPDDTLRLFSDDTVTRNEGSGGAVARIRLYNGPLSASEVAALATEFNAPAATNSK
jgi:hypothetical protein